MTFDAMRQRRRKSLESVREDRLIVERKRPLELSCGSQSRRLSIRERYRSEGAAWARFLRADPIYISSMQAVVRQMRAQIGRCLFVPFMRGSPAAYVQLRPISSDLEKCRAIIAIRMPSTMPCRSRSAIEDPATQMSARYPKLSGLR